MGLFDTFVFCLFFCSWKRFTGLFATPDFSISKILSMFLCTNYGINYQRQWAAKIPCTVAAEAGLDKMAMHSI